LANNDARALKGKRRGTGEQVHLSCQKKEGWGKQVEGIWKGEKGNHAAEGMSIFSWGGGKRQGKSKNEGKKKWGGLKA